MPFTFSHPAAILPLNHYFKRRVSTTGLVVGSIVPDFEYFVRVYHHSFYSHTWGGLFYLDVPVGVLLCFLYHDLVRKPFYANVPLTAKQRLAPFQSLQWNSWFAEKWPTVLISVLLGAFTHLVWDKLTHHTVPLVQSASGIGKFATEDGKELAYSFFWDINSFIGAALLLYTVWTLPLDNSVKRGKNIHRYWLCFFGVAAVLFFVQLTFIRKEVLDDLVIAIINAILLSFVFTSIFFTTMLRSDRKTVAITTKK